MKRALPPLLMLTWVLWSFIAGAAEPLIGVATVIDGDTIEQQSAVRGGLPTVKGCDDFLVANRWKIEGKKGIVGHGECGAFGGW